MKAAMFFLRQAFSTFAIILVVALGESVYSQVPCQQQKFGGTYRRVDKGIYSQFSFFENGSVIVYEALSGTKYNGSYLKNDNDLTIRIQQPNGDSFTIELQFDDDNTLIQKISLVRNKYVKEGNSTKKVLSKSDLLGKWKIMKSETKNLEASIEMLSVLLIITGASMVFTDDGKVLDSDGKFTNNYYLDRGQLFIGGKNAPYEFACLNGKSVLRITTEDEKKENVFNVVHLKK